MAHLNLGGILRARGDYAGSLALLRRGHELGSKQPGWPHPSRWWVAEAERRAALAERLTVVLKGESSPKDNAERLDLARMCFDTRRFAAAARFSAEAMEIDPKLGEAKTYLIFGDTDTRHHAACPAALAAVGQGEDDPRPDEAARNRLRTQARDWLRADLGLCSKTTICAYARGYNVGGLMHLKECSDLAGFRDATALSKIPEAERKQWQSLWAEIDALFDIIDAMTRHDLGNEVESQRMLDKAIAGFRSAIRLAPDHADSHCRLGNALIRKDKLDEASAAYREAIRLKPDDAEGHYGLGNALKGQGKLDDAIAEYREAIRLKPDHAEAHCNLGNALKRSGQTRRGHRRVPRGDPAQAQLRRSPLQPWRDSSNRAATTQGPWQCTGSGARSRKYAPGLHPSAEIRSQTLDWLKAERDAWSKLIDGGDAGARAQVVQILKQRKVDTNLAAVRDPEALARLPEPERKEWQSLWSDVDSLLERAQGHPAKAVAAASPMPAKAPEPDPNPTAAAVNLLVRTARPGPVVHRPGPHGQGGPAAADGVRSRSQRHTTFL